MTDTYVNAKYNTTGIGHVAPGQMLNPWEVGQRKCYAKETFELAVADAAGDIKRIFKGRDANEIPIRLSFSSDGVAGANDINVGLMNTNLSAVIVAGAAEPNQLADAMDLSAATTMAAPKNGLAQLPIENVGRKRLFEIAGDSVEAGDIPAGGYDIVMQLVSEVTAAGTIAIEYEYIQG